MADKLPGSLRQAGKRLTEQGTVAELVAGTVNRPRLNHSDHAIGGEQSRAFQRLPESARETIQQAHLAIAFPELAPALELCRSQHFHRNEWIANGAYSADPRGAQQRGQNLGKDVRVFVGVKVSDLEGRRIEFYGFVP